LLSPEEGLESFNAGFDLGDGDGVAEAQMAFALGSEDGTGNRGDVRLFE